MTRRRIAALVVIAAAGLIAAVTTRDRSSQPSGGPIDISDSGTALLLEAPAEVQAGTGFIVEVSGAASDEETVHLDLVTATGVTRLSRALQSGIARVTVPGELTVQSGLMLVTGATTSAAGQTEVQIIAGPAVDGIVPLAGPRSMIADTEHWTMVTAIPLDAAGNAMPDGTPLTLHVRRPDGTIELIPGEVSDLLAGIRVYSGTLAGGTAIRVDVGGASGPEVLVAEVPGPPLPFGLSADATPLRADGRTLIEISTEVLTDRYGNVLLDGTQAELVAQTPDGMMSAVGFTIDGSATFRLEAPRTPGSIRAVATVSGVASAPLVVDVEPEVLEFSVETERNGGTVNLEVGPVRTALGGYAPDGTLVLVEFADGTVRRSQLRDGRAVVELDLPADSSVSVTVLGVTRQVRVGS